MRTQKVIMFIVLGVVLAAIAVVVGLILWLGFGTGAITAVVLAIAAFAVFRLALRPWYIRWGASDAEVAMDMPGDSFNPNTAPATRAIGIAASPEEVWPWVAQIGFGKAGWYSYDWIDNDGHPSADRIIPEYQHLSVGDEILMMPDMGFTVTEIDPEHSIVSVLQDGSTGWALGLYPTAGGTRLVSRWRPKLESDSIGATFFNAITDPGSFIMEQKMLRGIRDRAEESAEART